MTSTQVPAIVLAAAWAQLLPAAALLMRRNLSRPVVLIALAYLGSFLGDWIARYVGHQTGNSHWVSILSGVIITSLLLVAIAEWQVSEVECLTFRFAVIPFVLAYAFLVFWVEDIRSFSQYAYPFSTLVLLGGAVWTLLRRSLQRPVGPLLKCDWFLIGVGLALNAATTAISTPIGAVLMAHQRIELLVQVWEVRSGCNIVALLLITAGTLRPSSGSSVAS